MTKKSGLGKGLGALIPGDQEEENAGGVLFLSVAEIQPNPHQPRKEMGTESLEELAASIREHGILQPLIVSRDPLSGQYELIAGERRLRAAILAGMDRVPVILRQVGDQQQLEMALIENVQRSDLTPLETAEAYRQLSEDFDLSHEEIALRVGKSRVSVTNSLRLLKLPKEVQKALNENKISEGHARALLSLSHSAAQLLVMENVIARGLNVRQTEELVRKYSGERPPRSIKPEPPVEIRALEDRLRNHFGTRVTLHHSKKGGSLTIHFYSDEELDALINQILKE